MIKRVAIVVPDKLVVVDGIGVRPISMEGMGDNIRAVQWYGDHGHEEDYKCRNYPLDDFSKYEFMIERWEIAHEKHKKEMQKITEAVGDGCACNH